MFALGDPVTFGGRTRLAELAAKQRRSAIYIARENVEAGGLMSYGPSLADLHRRAAWYAVEILKGTKPGDLQVKLPEKFEIFVNLKTSQQLGLVIPQHILLQADKIIR